MTTRRELLESGLTLAAALLAGCASGRGSEQGLGGGDAQPGSSHALTKAGKPLRILVLGGTGFLGPAIVEHARARGHTLTLFNRGKTNADLFPDVEKLHGDRKGQLDALKGRQWDAVLDDTGYVPKWVRMSAELLAPNVQQYVFVSSVSVYPDDVKPGADERTPTQVLTEPDTEEVMKHYGALKAACERTVEAALPGRTTCIRPGLIVGPGDRSDRYTYWVTRLARGGEVLAPAGQPPLLGPQNPVQIIDVRDLAAFMVHCLETRTVGTFNATGRNESLGNMLAACAKASNSDAHITYADEAFLKAHGCGKWDDLNAADSSEGPGLWQIDSSRARAAGLTNRSGEETARDTLAWWNAQPAERRSKPLRAGLTPQREAEVLAAWHAAIARGAAATR